MEKITDGTMQRETRLSVMKEGADVWTSKVYGTPKNLDTNESRCNDGQVHVLHAALGQTSCGSRNKLHVATILGEDGGDDPEKNVRN